MRKYAFRLTPFWLIAAVLFLSAAVPSVHAQRVGHDFPPVGSFHVPPVSYRLQMLAQPDSNLISGRIEISYRNESEDTLRDVYLNCLDPIYIRSRFDSQRPEPYSVDSAWLADMYRNETHYCLIDSLLFQGVPLTADQAEVTESALHIHMPVAIKPGEVAFFMGTIRVRSGDWPGDDQIQWFEDWFPKVVEFGDTVFIDGRQGGVPQPKGPLLGRYNVMIAVDSSWDMVAPGELVNEKEILGLLPTANEDSTWVDIVNAYQQTYMGRKYTPVFEDGLKKFFHRLDNDYYFPLVFAPEFIRDRTEVDGVVLDVCYPPDQATVWGGYGIGVVKELFQQYDRNFGPPPHFSLRFVVCNYMKFSGPFGSLFALDPDTTFLKERVLRSLGESYLMPAYGPYYDVLTREPWDLMQFMQITVAPELPYLEEERYNDINILAKYEKQLGHEVAVALVRDFLVAHRYVPIQYDDLVTALKTAAGELNTDSAGSSEK